MLRISARVAYRYLVRNRGYSILHLLGLALGTCGLIVLGLYIRHELTYESAHSNADRIFRIAVDRIYDDGHTRVLAPTSPPLAELTKTELPQVVEAVRLFVPRYTTGRTAVRHGATSFFEEEFFYADPSVFDVFEIPLLYGNPAEALANPHSVVLSSSMAQKYFGDQNPIGETMVIDDSVTVDVTGVMADWPSNSHVRPHFLAPYPLLEYQYGARATTWWGWDLVYTYVLLEKAHQRDAVRRGVQGVLDTFASPRTSRRGYTYTAQLQPLKRIHLDSNREWEVEERGDPFYLKALGAIGFFILLLACFNYVNLSTAKAGRRAREIGVRKVLGSGRRPLVVQFLSESVILALVATGIGVLAARALLPFVGRLAGIEIALDAGLIIPLIGLAVFVGIAAGAYPAAYLASLRPSRSLQGAVSTGGERGRSVLIMLQFSISIVLTAATLVVYQQVEYMRSLEPGFDKEQVLVVTAPDGGDHLETAKDALRTLPGVQRATLTSGIPGRKSELMQVVPEGQDVPVPVQMLWVDADFAETLGIEVAAGRDFETARPADAGAYVINETAAKVLGWEDPVGKTLSWSSGWGTKTGEVIGLVRDFQTASFREDVEPLVLSITPAYRYVALSLRSDDLTGLIGRIEGAWKKVYPDSPFEYAFLDDVFDRSFSADVVQGKILAAFALLAIMIACIGLFGLAAYSAEVRSKEIGIRKVLGASVSHILALLAWSWGRVIIAALAVSIPITYLAMHSWLANFTIRIEVGPGIFVASGLMVATAALLTVSYQTARAAVANPVDSLRTE